MFTTNVNHPVPRLFRNFSRYSSIFKFRFVIHESGIATPTVIFFLPIFCIPQKLSQTSHDRFTLNVASSQLLQMLCALLGSSPSGNKLPLLGSFPQDKQFLFNTVFASFTAEHECNSLYFLLSYGHQQSISWSEKRKTCTHISLSQAGLSRSEIPDDNTL